VDWGGDEAEEEMKGGEEEAKRLRSRVCDEGEQRRRERG
jgi:hypothetical protein